MPQDPQLLHRTIAENICYGLGTEEGRDGEPVPVVDYDLVHEVGQAAHVEEFVYALPDRYDTVVGERGLKLSGGQRQRVAIAQAMAKRAPILVLDEATSALDSESEHLVQEALWRLMEDATALVIAHRLSTIAHMDRIVVFDQGQDRRGGHPPASCWTHGGRASTAGCGSTSRGDSWSSDRRGARSPQPSGWARSSTSVRTNDAYTFSRSIALLLSSHCISRPMMKARISTALASGSMSAR